MTTFFIFTTILFLSLLLASLNKQFKLEAKLDNKRLLIASLHEALQDSYSELEESIEFHKQTIDINNKIIEELNFKNHDLQKNIEEKLEDIGL